MKPEVFLEKLRGPYMHLNTSFRSDNVWEVDHEAMRSNLNYMINNGATVVDATASAGEYNYLTDEERMACWQDLVAEGKGKVLTIAGNGHSSTKRVIEFTRYAESIGINGLMIIGPFGNTPDAEGLYQHYKEIAEATSLAVVIYNSPTHYHRVNVTPMIWDRLAHIPNIVAIKDCTYDMDQYFAYIRVAEKHHKAVICGTGELFYVTGALVSDVVRGWTCATATWDPLGPLDLYNAVMNRNKKEIKSWFRKTAPFESFKKHIQQTRPDSSRSVVKAPLDMIEGVRGGVVRPPVTPLTDSELAELKGILREQGLKVKD